MRPPPLDTEMKVPMSRIAHPDPVLNADLYADVPLKRLLAWVFDGILIAILVAFIVPFTAFTALFFLPALWLIVGFAYRVITLAGGSATFGMRLMSIELRNHHGERFGLGEATLHTLGYSLTMSLLIPQILSIILMLTTEKGQSLSDMVLGTVAINRAALRA